MGRSGCRNNNKYKYQVIYTRGGGGGGAGDRGTHTFYVIQAYFSSKSQTTLSSRKGSRTDITA